MMMNIYYCCGFEKQRISKESGVHKVNLVCVVDQRETRSLQKKTLMSSMMNNRKTFLLYF